MSKDYYQILEISKNATSDEVKKSYRKLARKYHPDTNAGNKEAENKFKELSEAYAVLSDSEKRKEYDSVGHETFTSGGHGYNFQNMNYEDMRNFNFGGMSFEDMFGDIFTNSRSSRGRRKSKGEDLTYSINIPFVDTVKGASYELNITRSIKCPECNGTGGKKSRCQNCQGTGMSRQGNSIFQTSCSKCGGTGEIFTEKCKKCNSYKVINNTERIKINIPAGVDNGSKIRIAGKGNASFDNGIDGDLYIITNVAPHPIYKRNGNDIYVKVKIDIYEASIGNKIEIPTPYGKVSLNIPAGTQNEQKFRLKEKGMPILRKNIKGDLYVVIEVIIPENLSNEVKNKLSEIMTVTKRPNREELLSKGNLY